MNNLQKLKYYSDALCLYLYSNCEDTVGSYLYQLLRVTDEEYVIPYYSAFFNSLSAHGSLKQYISNLILTDDNVFTRAAAAGKTDQLAKPVLAAVKSDLQKLEALSNLTAEELIASFDGELREILETLPKWEIGDAAAPLKENWAEQFDDLIAFHRENGYGEYVKHAAFRWHDEELLPITSPDSITLSDLKNYERQKQQVLDNTLAFLEGYPANNILLYGDRGTGKSSTVHAILNEYKNRSLRMIEISKGDIGELNLIRERISQSPMKFIIFIDDLNFDSRDDSFGELKAALEGSLSGRQSNTLIYATSNRRHLIKENFSDRENDVHRSDTMQEELSLSDRFGLSIYFMNPDKEDYLDITRRIAADRGLSLNADKLEKEAELWARRRGGRSPRCAKQFIDYIESCEKRNIDW